MNLASNLQVLATPQWVAGLFNEGKGGVGSGGSEMLPLWPFCCQGFLSNGSRCLEHLKAAQPIDYSEEPSKTNKQTNKQL